MAGEKFKMDPTTGKFLVVAGGFKVGTCAVSLRLQACVDRLITVQFGAGADNDKVRLVIGSRLGESSEYPCGFAGGCVADNDPNSTFLVDGVVWIATWFSAGGVPIPVGNRPDDGAYTDWFTMGDGKRFTAPIRSLTLTTGRGPVTAPTDHTVRANDDGEAPGFGGQAPYDFTIRW